MYEVVANNEGGEIKEFQIKYQMRSHMDIVRGV